MSDYLSSFVLSRDSETWQSLTDNVRDPPTNTFRGVILIIRIAYSCILLQESLVSDSRRDHTIRFVIGLADTYPSYGAHPSFHG